MEQKKNKKTRNSNTITESAFFSLIRSALRSKFRYWKPMQEALKLSSRPSQSTNKRLKTEYQCKSCKKWFSRKEVEVDHIVECGSLKCYEDIVPFIKRLTIEDVNGYQILCKKGCHLKKTKEERVKKLKSTNV